MNFKSRPEAYLYAIYIVQSIIKKYSDNADVVFTLEKASLFFRTCVENHEQNPTIVVKIIQNLQILLADQLAKKDLCVLKALANGLYKSAYEQTEQERWMNPLGRRFESQLQIELLQHPTTAMILGVKKISIAMLDILDKEITLQMHFLKHLTENSNYIAFGSFKDLPSYADVKKILTDNNSKDFAVIMYVHFKFSRDLIPQLKDNYESLITVFKTIEGKMFGSPYYADRGRAGEIQGIRTNKMGLLINDSDLYNDDLPTHSSSWVSDSKAQRPNFSSSYPKKLTAQDIPYVAGPSGMTSRFIAQMLALDVLPTLEEKQLYVLSVTAYMISAGFHSLHEVIGPVAFCLKEFNLVPGYLEAGNFRTFYDYIATIDSEFLDVLENGWGKLNAFFSDKFMRSSSASLPSYSDLVSITKEGAKNHSSFLSTFTAPQKKPESTQLELKPPC
ncbi:MAG: hypothetical protein Q8L78_08505 [Coxiellaceae bacterium]|nr:hypothetical protein [Coxiellaceae bacterium]